MSDLVERLHVLARDYHQHRPHYEEAAAEIERLRAENDMLRSMLIDAPTKAERDELFERRKNKP